MFQKKNKLRRKITFVIPNSHWGTYFLRGVQVKNQLCKMGIHARTLAPRNIIRAKNEILVFVKNMNIDQCLIAKNNNNIIIYDILDNSPQDLNSVFSNKLCDAIILSTHASKAILNIPKDVVSTILYHHIDPRLEKMVHRAKQRSQFSLCYIGNLPEFTNNTSYTDRIDNLTIIETDTRQAQKNFWMRKISPFTCHYAVRTDALQCAAKPLAKVGVAAVCQANMIVNRNNAAVELLGDDYPYLTNNDFPSVNKIILYARETFASTIWHQGLERMSSLKERLTLTTIINEYITLFKQWE